MSGGRRRRSPALRAARPARAARAVAWVYPRSWRRRYGAELEDLVTDRLEHGCPAWRVCADLLRAGLDEQAHHLATRVLGPERGSGGAGSGRPEPTGAGLALVGAVLVAFVALAFGLWSQLHSGLEQAGATGQAVPGPVFAAGGALGVALVLAGTCVVGGAAPVVVALVTARRVARPLPLRPLLVVAVGVAALSALGWWADASRWYSPAAAALPARGPAHLLTLWIRAAVSAITPAWVHPHLWSQMPAAELAAALGAPFLVTAVAVGVARVVVRLPWSQARRVQAVWAMATTGTMVAFGAGCLRWMAAHPAAQLDPGHAAVVVAVVTVGLAVVAGAGAHRVLRSAWRPDA